MLTRIQYINREKRCWILTRPGQQSLSPAATSAVVTLPHRHSGQFYGFPIMPSFGILITLFHEMPQFPRERQPLF